VTDTIPEVTAEESTERLFGTVPVVSTRGGTESSMRAERVQDSCAAGVDSVTVEVWGSAGWWSGVSRAPSWDSRSQRATSAGGGDAPSSAAHQPCCADSTVITITTQQRTDHGYSLSIIAHVFTTPAGHYAAGRKCIRSDKRTDGWTTPRHNTSGLIYWTGGSIKITSDYLRRLKPKNDRKSWKTKQ